MASPYSLRSTASVKMHTEPKNNVRSKLSNHNSLLLNNWTLAESRSAKKDNSEREREATLSCDSTPSVSVNGRQHTPHTYPRTKHTSSVRRRDLERLRKELLFDDEMSGTDNDEALEIVSARSDGSQSQDSGVQDATPDSNQIVGRLMQIRDYLKQASTIKESLNKDSPNSQEQFSRLNKLICHLGEQEEGYLSLLQKMLADRKPGGELLNNQRVLNTSQSLNLLPPTLLLNAMDANGDLTGNDSDVSLNVDGASEVSECTTSDREAEVAALKKQRDLLKKMLDQQKMLKSLHERQAELLELQRKSEDNEGLNNQRMANGSSALASEASLDNTLTANTLRGDNFAIGRKQTNIPSDEDKDMDEREEQNESSDDDSEPGEESVMSENCVEPPPTEEEGEVPAELTELRQRLHYLKKVFEDNFSQQKEDQERLEQLKQMQSAVASGEVAVDTLTEDTISTVDDTQSDMSSSERKCLRRKLQQLLDKKQKMEDLLGELQVLRQYKKDNDGAEDMSASSSTLNGELIREQQELTHNASLTVGQAETVLDVMEQESKLRKLDEVKGKLDQLRSLAQYYQSAGNAATQSDCNEETEDEQNVTSAAESEVTDDQDLSLAGNLRGASAIVPLRKASNPASSSVDDSSDIDSNISLGEFGDDPEIMEKVKKLHSARQRLARLQGLVNMVQQWPESAEVLPEDLAELAVTAVDDTVSECSTVSKASTTSGAQSFSNLYKQSTRRYGGRSESTNQKVATTQTADKDPVPDDSSLPDSTTESRTESEAFYLQRMKEQKGELHNLMLERNKLLSIQNELKSLHHQYIQASPQELQGALASKDTRSTKQADKSNSRTSGSRGGVTFSTKLHDLVSPVDSSYVELYSRMMEQKMKTQETRRTKGEEDQMTADVTTMATWGDSESTSSSSDESEEEDEDTPNDEAEIDEEDDGYPSDGIMQVEEEEEANRDSDRDTYTIEDDYHLRQRYPQTVPSRQSRNRHPHTHKLKEASNHASGDARRMPAKNQRAAVLAAEYGSGTDMISKMKDQLNATTEMCQHLLQEQHKLQCRITEQPNSADPWMESRVVYSVNQLFSQVTDMQAALKVTIDQVYGITQRIDSAGLELSNSTLRAESNSAEALSGLPIWARPSTALNLQSETRPGARPVSQLQSRLTQTGSVYSQQTDQSQSEGGDKTPTLELFQNSGRSERSGKTDSQTESARLNLGDHSYSIPPLDLDKLIRRRQEQSKSLQSTGRGYPSPSLSAIAAGRVKVPIDSMYKPGVSSGICGTSYADNTSISSAVSSAVSSVRGESYKDRTNSTPTKFTDAAGSDPLSSALAALAKEREDSAASDYSLFEALRETIYSEVATLISQNENRPHFLIQLFRELQMLSSDYLRQRVLYSVQELVTKFLTGEIFDVKGNKDESDNEVLAPQPAWMVYRTAGSEETPTESCVTTDDELRQSLPRVNSVSTEEKLKKFIDSSRGSISCDFADYIEHVETTSTHSTSQSQTGSMRDDPFNQDSLGDTVIHLEKEHSHRGGAQVPAAASHSGSSLGVAGVPWGTGSECSDISHDIPFACNSPLADTAVDLQQAMQKVKDIDKLKEAKRQAKVDSSSVNDSAESSSSAHDADASDAASDIDDSTDASNSIRCIDAEVLDRRIKVIMADIIPVLREHMENLCSSQLLDYLQNRVISLTKQTGESKSTDTVEGNTKFFHEQLLSVLKDSLAKFEGRRMRDCGEDMLVEISEILFNELAFFKLMQDIGDPEIQDHMVLENRRGLAKSQGQSASYNESESEKWEENSAADYTEDSEVSDAADAEEEELGKERDDAFAEEVNTAGEQTDIAMLKDVQFALAPSETKPMTRIGSDEDCSDGDEDSSDFSTDDGDDTAISRQTAQDQEPANESQDSTAAVVQSVTDADTNADSKELSIEDLPAQLHVDMESIAADAAAEKAKLSVSAAVDDVLIEGADELAGSATELKPPPSTATTVKGEQSEEKSTGNSALPLSRDTEV